MGIKGQKLVEGAELLEGDAKEVEVKREGGRKVRRTSQKK
jgi:ribosomal protein S9